MLGYFREFFFRSMPATLRSMIFGEGGGEGGGFPATVLQDKSNVCIYGKSSPLCCTMTCSVPKAKAFGFPAHLDKHTMVHCRITSQGASASI